METYRRPKRVNLDPYLLLSPALFFLLLFVAYPLVNTVVFSFFKYTLTGAEREFVGLANYVRLRHDPIFWKSLGNNVFILVGSVIFQVGGGLILASVLHRGLRRGAVVYRTLIFTPVVMSAVAVGILWKLIYSPANGLLTQIFRAFHWPLPQQGWLGDPHMVMPAILVVACWEFTGFMTVIMLAGMQSVPEDLYEAATLDGANALQSFLYITLPLMRNVIIAATLLTMIGAFKVFDLVYVLTMGGPANASQVLGTYVFYNAFTLGEAGYANALSVMLLLFALVLGIGQLRFSSSFRR